MKSNRIDTQRWLGPLLVLVVATVTFCLGFGAMAQAQNPGDGVAPGQAAPAEAAAEKSAPADAAGQAAPADAAPADAQISLRQALPQLGWKDGPGEGALGAQAKVSYGAGLVYLAAQDAQTVLQAAGNSTDGREVGMVLGDGGNGFWAIFEFDPVGYVKDDDKDQIDAEALLKSYQEGTEAANEARRQRGIPALHIVGWETRPFYDEATNNLTWAMRARSDDGGESVNHNVRLLGREGVMSVTLVTAPERLASDMPHFQTLLKGFSYASGKTYAEYVDGDKVAEYGLMGLMGAGALAVAAKSGLLQKLWKFILLGLVAVGGFLKKLFGGSTERLGDGDTSEQDTVG